MRFIRASTSRISSGLMSVCCMFCMYVCVYGWCWCNCCFFLVFFLFRYYFKLRTQIVQKRGIEDVMGYFVCLLAFWWRWYFGGGITTSSNGSLKHNPKTQPKT